MTSWLPEVASLVGLIDQQGQLVTVGAESGDGWVLAAYGFSKDPGSNKVVELGPQQDPMSPDADPKFRSFQHGIPPQGEEGWPWRWSMGWVASRVENPFETQRNPIANARSLRSEYEWSLARHIVRSHPDSPPSGWSVSPQQVIAAGERLMSVLDHDPRSSVKLRNHVIWYSQIGEIVNTARSRKGTRFVSSWPAPDNDPQQWRESGRHSPETMRKSVERVYKAALLAYNELSGNLVRKVGTYPGIRCSNADSPRSHPETPATRQPF